MFPEPGPSPFICRAHLPGWMGNDSSGAERCCAVLSTWLYFSLIQTFFFFFFPPDFKSRLLFVPNNGCWCEVLLVGVGAGGHLQYGNAECRLPGAGTAGRIPERSRECFGHRSLLLAQPKPRDFSSFSSTGCVFFFFFFSEQAEGRGCSLLTS